MLETLTLTNFQAHEALTIDFDQVTTITGPSDRGKSAIIRAIGAVTLNNFAGDGYLREGAREVSVELVADGNIIRRYKGKENGYSLGDQDFRSFGTGVPLPIEQALNIDPHSVQRQFDGPFWVSLSGGALADELNRVTGIGCLSDLGKEARRSLKDASAGVTKAEGGLCMAETGVESMAWVTPELVADAEKAEAGRDWLNRSRGALQSIQEAIDGIAAHDPSGWEDIASDIEIAETMLPKLDPARLSSIEECLNSIEHDQDIASSRQREIDQINDSLKDVELTCPTCGQAIQ